jgi:hypothetical protein
MTKIVHYFVALNIYHVEKCLNTREAVAEKHCVDIHKIYCMIRTFR